MASNPRERRRSRELPPHLSELKRKLAEEGTSFIQQFSSSEPRMTEIVEESLKISNDIKEMQRTTDRVKYYGATGGLAGLVMVVSLVAVPFTAGLSLAATAAGATAVGATAVGAAAAGAAAAGAAAVGAAAVGAAVAGVNIKKMKSESEGAKKVEKLGNEFLVIVEPMKKNLEEIKTACEKMQEKSAETQADNSLTDVEEFQGFLRQVSELKEKSAGVLTEFASMQCVFKNLLILIVSIFRVTPTCENAKKLEEAIIQSADQSEKVVKKFNEMRNELVEFIERMEINPVNRFRLTNNVL